MSDPLLERTEAPVGEGEFRCSMCRQVYCCGWSDEEAVAELKAVFGPEETPDTSEIVCDDCYKIIMADVPEKPKP